MAEPAVFIRRLEVHVDLFRPERIPLTRHLRARLHRGALLVVDVDATLWHSGLSWCAAWTAGGMLERPPPSAGRPATAWPLAVATRWSACDAPAGKDLERS